MIAVAGFPQEIATFVREHGRDPIWGHAAVTQPATGFGPCRLCLRTFRDGELRTLFTHDTYSGVAEFPQPGPVFIHAADCERYDGEEFPPELRGLELTFEGVAAGPRVLALERTSGNGVDEAIGGLLDREDVDYVNVRNTEAGCFVARVDRVSLTREQGEGRRLALEQVAAEVALEVAPHAVDVRAAVA